MPVGFEFQVNSHTPSHQLYSAAGAEANGDFVVTWTAFNAALDDRDVFARRFASSGSPQGSAFQVNSYTTSVQTSPAIGLDADGDFVIAWTSGTQDGFSGGVFAQRFDASGVRQGAEFQVNVFTIGYQRRAAVALDGNGDFVVAWESAGVDGNSFGIALRRFDSSGVAQGSELVANTFIVGAQTYPAIDAEDDGDFVVAWQSDGQDGSLEAVIGQRFSSAGAPLGPEFPINTYVTGRQTVPSIGLDADGDFVVAWESDAAQDGAGWGILARRFNSFGTPLGSELPVNSYTTNDQKRPKIVLDTDGDFSIIWESEGQDGDIGGVAARRFKASGFAQSADFIVNTVTAGIQAATAVAGAADGDFVVSWSREGDGDGYGVFARRFNIPIIVDVDGDGQFLPLTDGLLLLRFSFGFTGATLTTGAVGPNCTRCDAATITVYLKNLI